MNLSSQKIDPKNLSTQETMTEGREGEKKKGREGGCDGRNEERNKWEVNTNFKTYYYASS